jgi:hypothetical protein
MLVLLIRHTSSTLIILSSSAHPNIDIRMIVLLKHELLVVIKVAINILLSVMIGMVAATILNNILSTSSVELVLHLRHILDHRVLMLHHPLARIVQHLVLKWSATGVCLRGLVIYSIVMLLWSRCRHYLIEVDLLVLLERQENAVFPECNLQIIREISKLVPLRHLLLCERSPDHTLRVLVEPFAVLVGSPTVGSYYESVEKIQNVLIDERVLLVCRNSRTAFELLSRRKHTRDAINILVDLLLLLMLMHLLNLLLMLKHLVVLLLLLDLGLKCHLLFINHILLLVHIHSRLLLSVAAGPLTRIGISTSKLLFYNVAKLRLLVQLLFIAC